MAKIHVVCIPFPLQSHITSMMKLAKILHFRGVHITFVNTEFNHQRLLNSRGPDSLKEPFKNLINKLNNSEDSNIPPVSSIISDGSLSFTLQAAKDFGIPDMLYWPISFCAFVALLYFPQLVQRGLVPLKGKQN
ncbi:hypothetical protein MKW94_009456 [Papaver nudicaule]|uniref:Uncharacterized protein n=1 Tax=Papaver nudicaule TaxID=74823 RepID=A0AA41VMM6_PAPNU|nr:hypothetical protein [Papaver nudicaule]